MAEKLKQIYAEYGIEEAIKYAKFYQVNIDTIMFSLFGKYSKPQNPPKTKNKI